MTNRAPPWIDLSYLFSYLYIRWSGWKRRNQVVRCRGIYTGTEGWTQARRLEELQTIRDVEHAKLRKLKVLR